MAKSKTKTTTKRAGRPKAKANAGAPPANESKPAFTPDVLENTVIALPLLNQLKTEGTDQTYDIIIDVNRDYPGGREQAQQRITDLIKQLIKAHGVDPKRQGVHAPKTATTRRYVFGRLRGDLIQELVRGDRERAEGAPTAQERKPALYRVWPDFQVSHMTYRSLATVKADAGRAAFGAFGHDIVWAVLDSGIDGNHPHFWTHRNLELPAPLRHCDFTTFGDLDEDASERAALTDESGHGTHVDGIIAGALREGLNRRNEEEVQISIKATVNRKDEHGRVILDHPEIEIITGMAPACKLVSLKVLDERGKGAVSNLIAACERIQEINGNGRYIRIHGVNMSVGYDFEPSWLACGQSPLCVEVDRLVRSGVVVVVAAGNTGYGWNQSAFRGVVAAGMDMTIEDPGNAERAITVGSTHSEDPLRFGLSYFSSKGPTGDGRMKPDLVAPGENILSCGVARHEGEQARRHVTDAVYRVDSGTSAAAAHVSGIIAAFLSVCPEFIGRADDTKEIFTSNATDLKRAHNFQGHGLVDLFRAISYVRGSTEKDTAIDNSALVQELGHITSNDGKQIYHAKEISPIDVFISYSHKDERLRMQLGTHLSLLKRHGVISEWHDRRIGAGQEWVGEIDEHLNGAGIILLLVSAEFLASDYCYDTEMKQALARHEAGEAVVIPVIPRYVDWTDAPFVHLKALPKDGKPVTSWSTRDRAFADIAQGIREVVERYSSRPPARRSKKKTGLARHP